jgi:polar amino acid transport system ATP-binding protein
VRRRQRIQRTVTATVVTVVVLGLLGLAITLTPGWDRFQETFLSWDDAKDSFPGIRHGFWLNVKLFLICEVFILAVGLAVALSRQARSAWLAPLRVVAVLYTDVFRGVPTILLVLVMALGVPALNLEGLTTDPYIWAGVALVLSYGAYVAEVFRSGTRAQPRAGAALRRRAPGGATGDPTAAQRLRLAAEGHRPRLGRRCLRRDVPGPRLRELPLQLHVVRRRRAVLHRHHRASGEVLRLAAAALDGAGAGGRPVSLLELESVRKAYGDRVVLQDIDLTVDKHDVVCLIGSSGSGKSTLLRCLNLLEQVDDGVIRFDGREITDPLVDPREVRKRIGMVFQQYNLFPHLTVLDNCTLAPRRVHGTGKGEAEARARDLLTQFGLGEHVDKHPDRLSGGQQQRVALVRALCTSPDLLLLDEITAALDPELVGDVLTIVRDLAEAGTTLVLATHEMSFARDVATQVCFLDEGRILEQGPPSQVLVSPREERTRQFLSRVLPPSA